MADAPAPVPARPPAAAPQYDPAYVKRLEALVNKIWDDKDVGSRVQSVAKELNPDIRLPSDNVEPIVAPLKKEVEELRKTIAEEREARAKERKEAEEASTKLTMEQRLDAARKSYNLTEEGFNKMVERMKETGNFSDADAAAAWVISKEPPPKPPGPSWAPQKIDMKGNLDAEMVKLLHSDPEAYQDSQLQEFLRDPDKYVQDTLGTAA